MLSWKPSQQVEGEEQTGCVPDLASPTRVQQLGLPEVLLSQRKPLEYVDVMGWFSFKFYFNL